MSRIGRKPIPVPEGVKINFKKGLVLVEGGKGKLSWNIPEGINARIEEDKILIERKSDEKRLKALHDLHVHCCQTWLQGLALALA